MAFFIGGSISFKVISSKPCLPVVLSHALIVRCKPGWVWLPLMGHLHSVSEVKPSFSIPHPCLGEEGLYESIVAKVSPLPLQLLQEHAGSVAGTGK